MRLAHPFTAASPGPGRPLSPRYPAPAAPLAPRALPGALAAAVALCACGGALPEDLRVASRAGEVPEGFELAYDDYHPERGGERIVLRADRTISIRRWQPGEPRDGGRLARGEVTPELLAQTVELVVRLEAWEQRVDDEGGRLDGGRARLRISARGERASVWEWHSDLEATGRLVRIKQQLEALAFEVRHPLADGELGPMDRGD